MLRLVKYLNKYKKESIIGPLFKLLEACFELIVPLVMADIIDIGIADHNTKVILSRGVIMVALGMLGLTCSLTAQYFAAKAALGFGTALRNDMFRHIQSLSYTELDLLGTPTLVTRMTSDIQQAQTGVNLVLRLFLRSPFIVIGAVIMSFTIDVRLTLIFLLTSPILAVVIYLIMSRSIPYYKKVQKSLDKVSMITRENLSGVRVIRAFSRQKTEKLRFTDTCDEMLNLQIKTGRISALMNPATSILVNAAIVAILYVGAVRVDTGHITQGEVIALVNYMLQILLALLAVAGLITAYMKASASADRINEVFAVTGMKKESEAILKNEVEAKSKNEVEAKSKNEVEAKSKNEVDAKSKNKVDAKSKNEVDAKLKNEIAENGNVINAGIINDTIENKRNKLEFNHVGFRYSGSEGEALSDISFNVQPGQLVGIIGSTGSGKTTLVNLIPRFYDATSGDILYDGKNIYDYEKAELRKKIAVVPQHAVLFKGTLKSNLLWGNQDATDEELLDALDTAQGLEFVTKLSDGLLSAVAQNGSNYSGGQRQRLTIARALVAKPEVLILDDSSSALDYATDAKLRKSFRNKQNGMTIFLISQRVGTVKDADVILVLNDGRIVGSGTHDELLKTCSIYREICASQE